MRQYSTVKRQVQAGWRKGLLCLEQRDESSIVQPIEMPFRHGVVHGLNPNYRRVIVAAKAFSLLQATVDYFNRRRDEAERLEGAIEEQKPVGLQVLGPRLRKNSEARRALDDWQARPKAANVGLAHSSSLTALDADTPEASAAKYLELLVKKNYGGLAQMTVDYANRSIGHRAGRLRAELKDVTLTEWTIAGVEDVSPAMSKVSVTLFGIVDGESWQSEHSMRLMFAGDNFDAVVRGQGDGRWTVMADFLSGLWISKYKAQQSISR